METSLVNKVVISNALMQSVFDRIESPLALNLDTLKDEADICEKVLLATNEINKLAESTIKANMSAQRAVEIMAESNIVIQNCISWQTRHMAGICEAVYGK